MPSFAAIVAFASITFSAVVSALPTVAPTLSTFPATATAVSDIDQLIGTQPSLIPRQASSFENILDTASGQVTGLIAKIHAIVEDKTVSTVNVTALVDITVQIQDVLGNAVDDCKAASGSPDIDIDVAVKIAIELIQNICAIIQVVIDACVSIDISAFLSVAVQVCVQLAAVVKLLISLDTSVIVKIFIQIAADLRVLININADAFLSIFGV